MKCKNLEIKMLLLLFECVFADTTLSSLAGGSIINT